MKGIQKIIHIKSLIIGLCSAIGLFFLFGMVTAVIPNYFFTRMTPVGWLEYVSLVMTSLLLGTYIGLSYYEKKGKTVKCDITATSGGIFGFLTFGCSICNKILVLLFGITGVLKYFEPIRPFFGITSIVMLGGAVIYKIKQLYFLPGKN